MAENERAIGLAVEKSRDATLAAVNSTLEKSIAQAMLPVMDTLDRLDSRLTELERSAGGNGELTNKHWEKLGSGGGDGEKYGVDPTTLARVKLAAKKAAAVGAVSEGPDKKSMFGRSGWRKSSRSGGDGSADKDDGDLLDPLMEGDHVYLRVDGVGLGKASGVLSGDLAYLRCGVQLTTGGGASPEGLAFEDCCFRVVPMLSYRQRNEADARAAAKATATKRVAEDAADAGGNAEAADAAEAAAACAAERLLRQRLAAEALSNENRLDAFAAGRSKPDVVKYGSVCQLQHVSSGLFVTALADAAPFDPECRQVCLAPGSAAAYFRVLPRFKAQMEGSVVYHTHSVLFEAAGAIRGLFLHASDGVAYDAVPDSQNPNLPKRLRTGLTLECNLSPLFSTFVVRKHRRVTRESAACLATGQPFRLLHAQSEAFVQASCAPEKGEPQLGDSGFECGFGLKLPEDSGAAASAAAVEPGPRRRVGGDLLHTPYLRVLATDGATAPDPTNPANHSAKALWCVENATRSAGSSVGWDAPVRIRHVGSGLYLAVDTSAPDESLYDDPTDASDAAWFRCWLVEDARDEAGEEHHDNEDDEQDDEESAGTATTLTQAAAKRNKAVLKAQQRGWSRCPPAAMLFHVHSAERTASSSLPLTEVSVRLEHHAFVDPDTGAKRVLYLHNTERRKPPLAVAAATAASADGAVGDVGAVGAVAEVGGSGDGHVLVRSTRLVFSTAKSAQDLFKVMVATEAERQQVRAVKSLTVALQLHAANLADVRQPPHPEDLNPLVRALFAVMDLVTKGDQATMFDQERDWVKKATALAPAAFAALFEGEPDPLAQRRCKDLKLLDALFALGAASYRRTFPEPPWPTMPGPGAAAVQKFVHVAMQVVCLANPANQVYFGRQSGPVRASVGTKGSCVFFERQLWMDTILAQLEDPLGSAVTLSKLLSANEALLRKYATPKLVLRFADAIRALGPQRRLVDFFAAICLVGGNAVKANQEMVLRLTWMRPDVRRSLFLELRPLDRAADGSAFNGFPAFAPVKAPLAAVADGCINLNDPRPSAYLGQAAYEAPGGWQPVGVTWQGAADWGPSHPDALFWNAKAMGLRAAKLNRSAIDPAEQQAFVDDELKRAGDSGAAIRPAISEVVRLEELCWVLDPALLCEPVTGVAWSQVQDQLAASPLAAARFAKQEQLSLYLVGQLKLHAAMVSGRSYNCLAWLQRTLASYTTLVSLSYNPHLPRVVRAAAVDLVTVLYLDRFPQLQSCGKATLPEQLWVLSLGDDLPKGQTYAEALAIAVAHNLPLVRPLTLADPTALPCFALPPAHVLALDPDPFNAFPSHFKFFLLRNLANQYFKRGPLGSGSIVHAERSENALALSVAALIGSLLSFGFQSSLPKFQDLVPVLVRALDGRTDVASLNAAGRVTPFDPPAKRYELSSDSMLVTQLKVKALKCLADVTALRTNFRLGNALAFFQQLHDSPKLRKAVCAAGRAAAWEAANPGLRSGDPALDERSPMVGTLFGAFEALFEQGDGAVLMLGPLSGGLAVETILLDALMYDDDELFKHALQLLEATFSQRRTVLDALAGVTLLPTPHLPVFGNVTAMVSELGYLTFLMRGYSVWGVCSKVSGPFAPEKAELVYRTLDRLADFLTAPCLTMHSSAEHTGRQTEGQGSDVALADLNGAVCLPNQVHQEVARSLNLHATLLEGLAIDFNLAFKGSICSQQDKVDSRAYLVQTQRKVLAVVVAFAAGNPANQALIWQGGAARLCKLIGPLDLPSPWPEPHTHTDGLPFGEPHRAQCPSWPGLGAEAAVVACLRASAALCSFAIPRELFSALGAELNASPDPTTDPLFEFFEVAARPTADAAPLPRNQACVLEVFLSPKLLNLQACVHAALGHTAAELAAAEDSGEFRRRRWTSAVEVTSSRGSGNAAVAEASVEAGADSTGVLWGRPDRVVRLMASCCEGGNVATCTQMQRARLTMDAALSSVAAKLDMLEAQQQQQQQQQAVVAAGGATHAAALMLAEDSHASALVVLASVLMEAMVVDPHLYRKRGAWRLAVYVAAAHARTCLALLQTRRGGGSAWAARRADAVASGVAALDVARCVVAGARRIGHNEPDAEYAYDLAGGPKSLHALAAALACEPSSPPELADAALKLAQLLGAQGLPKANKAASELPSRLPSSSERPSTSSGSAVEMLAVVAHAPSKKTQVSPLHPPHQDLGSGGASFDGAAADVDDSSLAPSEVLALFVAALRGNPKVTNKLQARRFQFAKVLEDVEAATAGGAVVVTWSQLVDRLVRFAHTHNFDTDESHVLRVFHALRATLVRARSRDDGSEYASLADLSPDAQVAYAAKQRFLDARGVTSLACRAAATHSARVVGNLADAGLALLSELLHGGNSAAQATVAAFIGGDPDGKWLRHLAARVDDAELALQQRKARVASAFEPLDGRARAQLAQAQFVLKLLQQCCAVHGQMQLLLRHQPMHGGANVNLVARVVQLLALQAETAELLQRTDGTEVALLAATLECLIELTLGPEPSNQELLSRSDALLHALDKILQSGFDPRVPAVRALEAKASALGLLAALLEGRHDRATHAKVLGVFEPAAFEPVHAQLAAALRDHDPAHAHARARAAATAATAALDTSPPPSSEGRDAPAAKAAAKAASHATWATARAAAVSLERVRAELALASAHFQRRLALLANDRDVNGARVGRSVAEVEVFWQGRVEAVSFQLPQEAAYLSADTKARFLATVDLSTSEKRLKALLAQTPHFVGEMVQVHALAQVSPLYRAMLARADAVKLSLYALVCLLNFNVGMATYGPSNGNAKGYGTSALAGGLGADALPDGFSCASLAATWALTLLVVLGHAALLAYHASAQVPMLLRRTDAAVAVAVSRAAAADARAAAEAHASGKAWLGPSARAGFFNRQTLQRAVLPVGALAAVGALHLCNYPGGTKAQQASVADASGGSSSEGVPLSERGVYRGLALLAAGHLLVSARRAVVVPHTRALRVGCVLWDACVGLAGVRNSALLAVAALASLQYPYCASLLLLDVMTVSRTLGGMIHAVGNPTTVRKLSLVFFTMVVTSAIYAHFGLAFFESHWKEVGDSSSCGSVAGCFIVMLYSAIPGKAMGSVMSAVSQAAGDDYLKRIAFDLIFFLWVQILLYGILTGLLVDAFGTQRMADKARVDQLANECFVCAFRREPYDEQVGTSGGPSFDAHRSRDHDVWAYVFFVRHLATKDPEKYTGAEMHVATMLQANNLAWLPTRSSLALQSAAASNNAE